MRLVGGISMPNHCWNSLSVTGPSSDVKEFIYTALQRDEDNHLTSCPDLRFLYPIAADVKIDEREDILSNEDYTWRTENWGTKWNTYSSSDITIHSDPFSHIQGVDVDFETAWAPPIGAIARGSELFPSLTFMLYFYEPGVAFKGIFVVKDGVEFVHDIRSIEDEDEDEDPHEYVGTLNSEALEKLITNRENPNLTTSVLNPEITMEEFF